MPRSDERNLAKVKTDTENVPPTAAQTVRSAARVSLSSQNITVFLPDTSFSAIMLLSCSSAAESAGQFTAFIIYAFIITYKPLIFKQFGA